MAPALPFIVMGGILASAATSIYGLVNAPKAPQPQSQTGQDRASLEAAYAQAEALRKRRGAQSTILTSPLGTPSAPQTVHATLGG